MSPPCKVDDLPGCDAVFISHNHYDHLDYETIRSLLKKFPNARYFVPLRNQEWFVSTGVSKEFIFELDWWQDRLFDHPNFNRQISQGGHKSTIRVTCVPAQHNSGRGVADQGTTLWCGWLIERFQSTPGTSDLTRDARRGVVFHAGDTGYRKDAASKVVCPVFKDIGDRFGPIDLSFIPIWRGGTLGFASYLGLRLSLHEIASATHGTPEDAACIHKDVRSRNTIAVHWGTFVGSETESHEATVDFDKALEKAGIRGFDDGPSKGQARAGTIDYGGSLAVEID